MPTDASASSLQAQSANPDSSVIETIQSLIVAFVLAMTFRGFVTEGFVIPTGSMAPTLLGQHLLIHSEQTGYTFPVGMDQAQALNNINLSERITDPMLGPAYAGSSISQRAFSKRMGDRILVLKCLYPFAQPNRYDVVVFKNPTDPIGDAANYIKRLIGLPGEHIWLADGDVFAKKAGEADFHVQRKPEHVQRAVWQPVYHSDYIPIHSERLDRRYDGPPWEGSATNWDLTGRTYRCSTVAPTAITWDPARRPLNDWTPYNMLAVRPTPFPMSDVRVSAGLEPQQAGLLTTLEIEARGHLFQFIIDARPTGRAVATMRMRPSSGDRDVWVQKTAEIDLPDPGPDRVFNVDFWHVDQSMHMFLDGEAVMGPLDYDWSPLQRLEFATGEDTSSQDIEELIGRPASEAQLRWRFEGTPIELHRVRVDRDLFYRPDRLSPGSQQQRNRPFINGPAFAVHPEQNAGILKADQFMMCGDNSQASLDSRLWGSPHPLVASQIDDSPFVVHRKLLLGKAWVVYFPAPFPITEGGVPVVPDFGRLRFIR